MSKTMKNEPWQLSIPVSAIVFDCDSTLSSLEGIDELAKNSAAYEEVKALTSLAMNKTGINPDLYQKRLNLIHPTLKQMIALGEDYYTHRVPEIIEVIQVLQRLNKTLYIVSAGFFHAIALFAEYLHIPVQNIFAVNLEFDQQGNFINYDHSSPLIHNDGKRHIIEKIKKNHTNLIHVGDGLNDFASHGIVTRFVGYGGIVYRKKVAEFCDYYINTPSMSALLPLCLTKTESESLLPEEETLYQKGLSLLREGKILLKS